MSATHVVDRVLFGVPKPNLRSILKLFQVLAPDQCSRKSPLCSILFNSLSIVGEIADCYDGIMNFAKPILICDANEEFRGLVREMLTKNGFFHVVEASNSSEAMQILREKKKYFIIVHPALLSTEFLEELADNRDFLVLADNNKDETAMLATKLGVNHILSFPFHSRKLMEKITSLI